MVNVRFDTGDLVDKVTVFYGDDEEDTYTTYDDNTEMITTDFGAKTGKVTVYDSEGRQQQYSYRRYTKVHIVWAEDDDDLDA